jgi:hypothetical protein
MNTENKIFKKLLSICELFQVYLRIGVSLHTEIDLKNTVYDQIAIDNSIELLISLKFIKARWNKLIKTNKNNYSMLAEFKDELYARIRSTYRNMLMDIFSVNISYDENAALYYIKRNSVELSLSGMIMLLSGLAVINTTNTNIYILDKTLINNKKMSGIEEVDNKVSIYVLRNSLHMKDFLGSEAERIALEFEVNLLNKNNINKKPEIISDIDVAAGYDIVSYMNDKSDKPDKFIEVKSCADDSYKFYISSNEVEIAKVKGENYYLYLYNRKTKTFKIISNPHDNVFKNTDWATTPQVFEMHLLT